MFPIEAFAKDMNEPWLVVNTNIVEGTDLLAWVADEFYFLPFKWELGSVGNKSGLRTSITQGYGGSLTCRLLAGNTFQQTSKVVGEGLSFLPTFETNISMPILDEDSVLYRNNNAMDAQSLKPGTHLFAVEWVWGLKAFDGSGQKAAHACGSLILAGWGRGEANLVDRGNFSNTSVIMPSNTTIICNQQTSTGELRVTVNEESPVKRLKLMGEPKGNSPRIFYRSTSVGNFTAHLAMLLHAPKERTRLWHKAQRKLIP